MLYKNKLRLIIGLGFLWVTVVTYAQKSSLSAKMDSTLLMIGEQSKFSLTLTTGKEVFGALPILSDTLIKGIEIVEIGKTDTTYENNLLHISQEYVVTSFDSGLYYIPPFKAIVGKDTVLSNPLALKVFTLPIDSVSIDKLKDIKGIMKPEFVWTDYDYILYILIVIVAIALAIYSLIKYLKEKKRKASEVIVPELLLPPHVAALKELDRIKEEKLWQQGREKEYFTEITEALRLYIDRRYDVSAMEITSAEIIALLTKEHCEKDNLNYLKQILLLADLVKFAKFKPLPDENILSLSNAYLFVNNTKEEEPAANEMEAVPSTNDVQSKDVSTKIE